jgi:hypothetical protein
MVRQFMWSRNMLKKGLRRNFIKKFEVSIFILSTCPDHLMKTFDDQL